MLKVLSDFWAIYDNSAEIPKMVAFEKNLKLIRGAYCLEIGKISYEINENNELCLRCTDLDYKILKPLLQELRFVCEKEFKINYLGNNITGHYVLISHL